MTQNTVPGGFDTDYHHAPDIEQPGNGTSGAEPPPDFAESPPHETPPPEFTSNAPTPSPEMILATNQSPPPMAAPAPETASPPQPTDPRISGLKAMFPDFDDGLLLSVLESVNSDQDRAVDVLLGMSDPEYVSTTHASGPPEPSQTDLDEQLARRLMLEEEQQAAQYQRRVQSAGWPNLRDNPSSQPYQSRTQGGRSPPQQQGERDTVTEFQESFNKIAESGKKTFSSIVSKVKAKMQEFDQNQNQRQGEPSNPGYSYANAQPAWSAGQPRTNTYAQPPPASYYDPNGPDSAPSRGHSYSENYGSGGGSLPPVQGYNMDPHPAPRDLDDDSLYVDDSPAMGRGTQRKETSAVSSTGANTAAIATSASPPSAASPVAPPRPSASPPPASAFTSGGVARPPATGTGTGRTSFDASKLGILPKRPVSLLRPGTQSPPPRHVTGDDDDDELEYTENPFEDGKK